MSQNQQNSSNNIPVHLNIATTNSTNSSISNFNNIIELQQSSDVYEFHSSPDNDNIVNYFPNVSPNLVSSFNQYKSPVTVSPSLSTTPKRIKTAILAKKLVAAAAVESSSDSTKLSLMDSLNDPKPEGLEFCQHVEKEEKDFEEDKEEIGIKIDQEEMCENEEINKQHSQPQRAHSFTCGGSQEQKKVPPLRISLIKTPSEEGEAQQPTLYSPVSSTRKSKRTNGGRFNASPKEDIRRITRSRVRQTNNFNNNEEDENQQKEPFRKRPKRILENYTCSGFLEEEDASSAAECVGEDNLMIDDDENDEEQKNNNNEENSQHSSSKSVSEFHSASRSTSLTALAGKEPQQNLEAEKNNNNEGNDETNNANNNDPSIAATLFAKNSFEQSICYEAMINNKWSQNYVAHLSYLVESMQSLNEKQPLKSSKICASSTERDIEICKELPEPLKKLFLEQSKRRDELTEEHCLDKERISQMAEREMCRLETVLKQKTNLNDGTECLSNQRENFQLFPVVSCLRDLFCHDPTLLAQTMQNPNERRPRICTTPSINHFKQRFTKLVNTTKNRHLLEAQSLMEVQKADWQRAAFKLQREQEQQQLLLKGLINASKKQQQPLQPQISFPSDYWMDTAVKMIEISNAQLPQFNIV